LTLKVLAIIAGLYYYFITPDPLLMTAGGLNIAFFIFFVGQSTFDMMGWAWYDADILHALWHSPGAYGGYQSSELDALLQQTRTTVDPNERLTHIRAVQAYLLENTIMIPIYSPGWLWMYASKAELDGFKVGPFNRPLFNDVRWTQEEGDRPCRQQKPHDAIIRCSVAKALVVVEHSGDNACGSIGRSGDDAPPSRVFLIHRHRV